MFLQIGKKALSFIMILTFLMIGAFDISGIHSVSAATASAINTSVLAGRAAQIYDKYYGNLNLKQKSAFNGVIKKN